MISKDLSKALNEQVNAEFYSAYLYLAMSAYTESTGMKGIANWLYVQAKEEMAHAIHMYQYILDRGAAPSCASIESPPVLFNSTEDIFEKVFEHEQKITKSINAIATLAMQTNDHACYQFIMWYVNEQVEEESHAADVLNKVKMIGNDKGLLLSLDQELATRTYVNPFPGESKLI